MKSIKVKIVRSHRRRRTASAHLLGDALVIKVPARLSEDELDEVVTGMKSKMERKRLKEELRKNECLFSIFQRLNEKYFGNKLKVNTIEYSTAQNVQFGSCNFKTGHIRISHRVRSMPVWVRDYVIVHEMAHLLFPNHGKDFWNAVNGYLLAERARGYLIAMGFQLDNGQAKEEEA